MKYRYAAFNKEGEWYVIKENSNFEVEKVKVPADEVFYVREKAYNPRTEEIYYENVGYCWEGELNKR